MNRLILLLVCFGVCLSAQTRDANPRQIAFGSSLPAACDAVGELFWLTSAMTGLNLYGSTTSGGSCVWTVLSGTAGPQGPPGSSGSGSGTVTVSGGGNLTSTDCVTGAGTSVLQTPSAGCTVDASGNLVATSVTTAAGKPVPFGPTTTVSANAVCWNSTTGLQVSDCGFVAVTNARTISTTAPLGGGGDLSANRTLTCSTCTITIASGTVALATSAISAANCSVVTATATGALTTDVPIASTTGDISAVTGYIPLSTGTLSIYPPWLTLNTINVKVCNATASSITPGAVTVVWRVVR